MKLSIIIPVYNVEKYITRCIQSCLDQDISKSDYEVIIINDGSTDSSLILAEQFKLYNISIYTQNNSGLSIARNNGLQRAKGEYVWFVDSDDWIEENCLGRVLIESEGCDVLAFGCVNHADDRTDRIAYANVKQCSGKHFMQFTKCRFMMGAPFYLYRRQFLIDHGLSFLPDIYHEDAEFTPRALYFSETIRISKGCFYQRQIRNDSITRTGNPKKAYDLLIVCNRLDIFASREVQEKSIRKLFYKLNAMFLNMAMNILSSVDGSHSGSWNQEFRHNKSYHVYLKSGSLKYIIEGILLFIFRKTPVKIYYIIKSMIS